MCLAKQKKDLNQENNSDNLNDKFDNKIEKYNVELFNWGCFNKNQFKSIEYNVLPKKVVFEG